MRQQPMWLSAHSLINAYKIKFNFGCLIASGGQNYLLSEIIDKKRDLIFYENLLLMLLIGLLAALRL